MRWKERLQQSAGISREMVIQAALRRIKRTLPRGNRPDYPKVRKLARNHSLTCLAAEKLHHEWYPAQVAVWLKRICPTMSDHLSHEAINRMLCIQTRGALKRAARLSAEGENNAPIA